MKAALIYPDQLFPESPALVDVQHAYLVEDPLFFSQYKFHKQKLLFHRLSMSEFVEAHAHRGIIFETIPCALLPESGAVTEILAKAKISHVQTIELDDDWLKQRLSAGLKGRGIRFTEIPHPDFLTPRESIQSYEPKRDFFFFNDFYINQRKALNILVDHGKPQGGKWSFDKENRKKWKNESGVPGLPLCPEPKNFIEVKQSIEREFPENPGTLTHFIYPTSRKGALEWMEVFFRERLREFGPYEDAISTQETFLFHSQLSPLLNVGLISPDELVQRALRAEVSLASKEGFLRQVIGWREFVRLVYHRKGRVQRTRNYLNLSRTMPRSFYEGTTGILPFDTTVKRVLKFGYCHHIERLMVLGNFMLLTDIHPDQVYRWFMELFIDAYDWVMVPNVYGMSQFADGGLMTTKPYISGSAYILKMSDYKKAPWCEIWDGLYWRFIARNAEIIGSNPRTAVMVQLLKKLESSGKLKDHITHAEKFLSQISP